MWIETASIKKIVYYNQLQHGVNDRNAIPQDGKVIKARSLQSHLQK